MGKRTRRDKAGEARSVSASELKNDWHAYLAGVSQAREEIIVTRYGKPIAKLTPFEGERELRGIFGVLAGTVTVHGDLIAPLDAEWEADA
jgi:prevent-host-death family protein